ncbi:hypothetical protein PHLCEN_2v9833 [Hermanssonia centrifuga]|uniref:NmrA-like domain-containing protein n=1 Tax=Hermanssonia centrifuga TaxID=98765 RepID=A0A2R6NPK5_9APHY|nr:hypothetical protein PHLCEN_2v9833 [Hermanssonia centrifuga]
MVKVAVAGGTGGIGRHIVDAILNTQNHQVVVLSRSPHHADLQSRGAEVIAVSYDDPTSLENALRGVHTVISTISDGGNINASVTSQLALLQASVQAGAKRFAPSEFNARPSRSNDPIELYTYKAVVTEAVKNSGLEYTLFESGIFMNYLASGTKGVGYLNPLKFVFDVENYSAKIPGDGNSEISWTRGEDVGAFVAASLELESWPEVSWMAGDRKSFNEILKLAEKIRGKTFDVTFSSADDLRKQLQPNPPSMMTNFYNQVLLQMIEEFGPTEPNLNALCPQVKPLGAEEFLKAWWGGSQKE